MSAPGPRNALPAAVAAARWFLGAVFIASAAGKLLDPSGFAENVAAYRLLPYGAVNVFSIVMAWTELLVGLSLLNGVAWRSAALVSAALNVTFIVAILSALARGLSIECGCFTLAKSTVGWSLIARDLVLFGLSVFVMRAPEASTRPVRETDTP